jgi:hypothetical protein
LTTLLSRPSDRARAFAARGSVDARISRRRLVRTEARSASERDAIV